MTMTYQQRITEALARTGRSGTSARHIEAWMRLEHPTLDHLDQVGFAREVAIAVECVDTAGEAESERLAESYGL